MVLAYVSTTQAVNYKIQHLPALLILADMEFGNELPLCPSGGVPLDRHVEGTLAIDIAGDICVQIPRLRNRLSGRRNTMVFHQRNSKNQV